jgi:hypothetical protein
MSGTRLYFLCPNTRRWFSTTFEKIPSQGPIRGLFTINRCRYCEFVHRYKGSEVRRSRPASAVPNPKLGQKAKSKRFFVRTGPLLSMRGPKLKDPCYGSLSEADQKRAEEAQLASTLFMLEGKLRCLDCGALVGAKKSIMSSYYEPYPRPHERPRPTRQAPRKRGPYKRM